MKKVVAHAPRALQNELKRVRYARQIRRGAFVPDEPEIALISTLPLQGACVVDVGANIGHYTCHMAACVGAEGRVIALEPLLDAFWLLTANIQAGQFKNVTLVNAAASSSISTARITVPKFESSGLDNLYRAHLSPQGDYSVLCLPLDSLPLVGRVALIKIDAEGHDLEVLKGAERLIATHRPHLVVESTLGGPIAEWLTARGYDVGQVEPGSPNIVATFGKMLPSSGLSQTAAAANHR